MKKPCSIESTPAPAATARPAAPLQCAITLRPQACAVSTTTRAAASVNCGSSVTAPASKSMIPVRMSLISSLSRASSRTEARMLSSSPTSAAMKAP